MKATEFLIIEVGGTPVTGSSLVLRGVADSEAKAKDEIKKLSVAAGARLAIVETKGVYILRPVVELESFGDTVVGPPKT